MMFLVLAGVETEFSRISHNAAAAQKPRFHFPVSSPKPPTENWGLVLYRKLMCYYLSKDRGNIYCTRDFWYSISCDFDDD